MCIQNPRIRSWANLQRFRIVCFFSGQIFLVHFWKKTCFVFFFFKCKSRTHFSHRKKFLSQTTKICQRKNLPSQKQVSVTKNSVTEKSFHHKKISFTETSFCNRNKSCPHARPLQLKVLQNIFLLFLAQNFCHHLYCHLAFFSEQSERTTFADLIKAFLLWEHFIMDVLCLTFNFFLIISILHPE